MMKLFKGILTACDGEFITPRTGVSTKKVQFQRLPKHGDYIPFIYEEIEDSPGVRMATDNVEELEDGMFLFEDNEGRKFKLEVIDETL